MCDVMLQQFLSHYTMHFGFIVLYVMPYHIFHSNAVLESSLSGCDRPKLSTCCFKVQICIGKADSESGPQSHLQWNSIDCDTVDMNVCYPQLAFSVQLFICLKENH